MILTEVEGDGGPYLSSKSLGYSLFTFSASGMGGGTLSLSIKSLVNLKLLIW